MTRVRRTVRRLVLEQLYDVLELALERVRVALGKTP